jgi:hypothetical protein
MGAPTTPTPPRHKSRGFRSPPGFDAARLSRLARPGDPGPSFPPNRARGGNLLNWLKRRRLSTDARKKLLIVTARAEEALIETHVTNMLDLLRTLGDEIDLDRGISLYTEALSLDETLAGTVANRLLARLESPSQKDIRQAHRFRDVFKDGRRR